MEKHFTGAQAPKADDLTQQQADDLTQQRDAARQQAEQAQAAVREIACRAALYRDFCLQGDRLDRAEVWDSARKLAEEYVADATPAAAAEPAAERTTCGDSGIHPGWVCDLPPGLHQMHVQRVPGGANTWTRHAEPAATTDPAACIADDPDHAGMTCDEYDAALDAEPIPARAQETTGFRYRQGGMMRCCIKTLTELYERIVDEKTTSVTVREGAELRCQWCQSKIVFRDGAWEWDKSRSWYTPEAKAA